MAEHIIYSKSNMPGSPGSPTPDKGPRTDQGDVALQHTDPILGDRVSYPSLSHDGRLEVEFPLRNSSSSAIKSQKFQARDLGHFVAKRVEDALGINQAHLEFAHFSGCCKGQGLLDSATMGRMEELSRRFAAASDPAQFFAEQVSPWLASLTPGRREKP